MRKIQKIKDFFNKPVHWSWFIIITCLFVLLVSLLINIPELLHNNDKQTEVWYPVKSLDGDLSYEIWHNISTDTTLRNELVELYMEDNLNTELVYLCYCMDLPEDRTSCAYIYSYYYISGMYYKPDYNYKDVLADYSAKHKIYVPLYEEF